MKLDSLHYLVTTLVQISFLQQLMWTAWHLASKSSGLLFLILKQFVLVIIGSYLISKRHIVWYNQNEMVTQG